MIVPHDSIVVKKICALLVPVIQLFGLYVFFHGHHSPGGGFQGGVLIGASLILKELVTGRSHHKKQSLSKEVKTGSLGLAVYAGIGVLPMLAGVYFLDYGGIPLPGTGPSSRRFLGILGVELGVLLVVAATLVIIFHVLAGTALREERTP